MLDFIASPMTITDVKKLHEAGATSVLVASPFFSVRGLQSFDYKELTQIRELCHHLSMNMYCLVNRFFVEAELTALREHLSFLKTLCVDGIYYGDESVLYEAMQLNMQDKLIYNPDTLITNHQDVQYYLDEGIYMVSISKEITLDEICSIARQVNGACEVILHGRLNMMHSKRNLLSNYMDVMHKQEHVKDNMHLYLMEETRDEHMPIVEDDTGTHVFSGFTLASFAQLPAMMEAGIRHVRIEGLFHDVDYVCEALRLYQLVIKQPENATAIFDQYVKRYPQDHVTTGFYYTKTSKAKEN